MATAGPLSIEVEAKFPFTEADKQRIASRGQLKGTKIFTDTYWDQLRQYPLTTRDMWLRQRGAKWELKVPVTTWQGKAAGGPSAIDQYKEFGSEPEILAFLANQSLLAAASQPTALEQHLRTNGLEPFAKITTDRLTYECDGVTVTFDTATPLNYCVGEIELLVEGSQDMAGAEARLRSFAEKHELTINSRMPGKVLEHIRRNSPRHWKALRESGQLKSKNVHEY